MPGVTTHGKRGFSDVGTWLDLLCYRAETGQVPGPALSATEWSSRARCRGGALCGTCFLGPAVVWPFQATQQGTFSGPWPSSVLGALPGRLQDDVTSAGL